MKRGLYVVYDKAANDISSVFDAKTLSVANRQFYIMIRDSPFVEEYELWRVGFMEVIDVGPGDQKIVCQTKISDLFEIVNLGSDVISEYNKKAHLKLVENDKS